MQTNATAYYGSVHVNAVNNRTIVFPFQLIIDVEQFDYGIEAIEMTLMQNNFAEQRLFSFSNYLSGNMEALTLRSLQADLSSLMTS